ncbi:MAG: NAD(P)-dependent oxidoreductase [Pirellulaceae bacterium]
MKVLVTGGAGYVGSVLIPQLLSSGHEVTVLDNLRYGGQTLLPHFCHEGFAFVKGDVGDAETVRSCVGEVDAVVHLAAIVGFPACLKYPEVAEMTNVQGTKNVSEAVSANQPLVFASTGSNYGKLEEICTEESPLNPVSFYAITKTQGEEIVMQTAGGTVLRFATAFGASPRMRLDLLVNDFVHQAVINKQLIVYERGFRRTFIHVRDMGRAIQFSLENYDRMKNNSYNVGHESLNYTKEDIAVAIRERVPFYLHYAEVGTDPDQRDYEVSYKKIQEIGFETTVTLDEGISELIRVVDAIDVTNPWLNV